jgi:FdhD protein
MTLDARSSAIGHSTAEPTASRDSEGSIDAVSISEVSASAERPGTTLRRTVVEVVADGAHTKLDSVVTEEPLEIRLAWPGHPATRIAVTMRTPGADFELAAGYLLAEGSVGIAQRPRQVAYCVDRALTQQQRYNVVTVDLNEPPRRHPSARTTTMSSACGVCGTESLDEVFTPDSPVIGIGSTVDRQTLSTLPDLLRAKQRVFDKTGSLHAAGVFDFAGNLILSREDIGRHNTVDKVMGARQLGSVEFGEDAVLCVSGRIGFDIISKAVAGRVGVVVAVGGPSSLAVQLAERAGITVVGFARGERFVVYTHPARIGGV